MAIQESKKQTDIEKRLKLLRNQLYGKPSSKEVVSSQPKQQTATMLTQSIKIASTSQPKTQVIKSDMAFLYQDLFKIAILATAALGIQIILFFLSKNHFINLNFF